MPIVTQGGFKIRIKKGRSSLTPAEKSAVSDLFSEKHGRLSQKASCVIVVAHNKHGSPVAFQRCEGRKLRAHNEQQCRKGGKVKKVRNRFAPC